MKILNSYLRAKQSYRAIIRAVAWIVLLIMFPHCRADADPPTAAQVAQAKAELRIYYIWINAPWTQDDRPYQRIRDDIDQALAKGQNSDVLFKQYQAAWSKASSDFQAQFGYYYAAYRYANDPKTDEAAVDPQVLYTLSTVLIRTPHPHTYNYVRMAFLCGQYDFIDSDLKAVGIRLLRRDPNDYDVKYFTTACLALSPLSADSVLARTYAHSLVKNYPEKPSVHSLAAYLHYQSWLRTKNKQDAAQAIAEFQQYLQLAPIRYRFRKQAEKYIAQIQNG